MMMTALVTTLLVTGMARASEGEHHGGGEASLVLPDLEKVQMLGMGGKSLLLGGLAVSALGLVFRFTSRCSRSATSSGRRARRISSPRASSS
jgi:K(+)-stimulated pyrophosphate-energized sodium pump